MRRSAICAPNVAFRFSPPCALGTEFRRTPRGVFGKNRGENNLGSFLKKVFRASRPVSLDELVPFIERAWLPKGLTRQF
jgi:hypothetical protein